MSLPPDPAAKQNLSSLSLHKQPCAGCAGVMQPEHAHSFNRHASPSADSTCSCCTTAAAQEQTQTGAQQLHWELTKFGRDSLLSSSFCLMCRRSAVHPLSPPTHSAWGSDCCKLRSPPAAARQALQLLHRSGPRQAASPCAEPCPLRPHHHTWPPPCAHLSTGCVGSPACRALLQDHGLNCTYSLPRCKLSPACSKATQASCKAACIATCSSRLYASGPAEQLAGVPAPAKRSLPLRISSSANSFSSSSSFSLRRFLCNLTPQCFHASF